MPAPKPAYRRAITLLLVGMFGLITLAVARDLLAVAVGWDDEPIEVTLLQLLSLPLAGATALGAWKGKRWAWITALGYGIVTAALFLLLGPLLSLPDEARPALWMSALAILAIAALAAWHLRRITAAPPHAPSAP
jgi:hypothetical protein